MDSIRDIKPARSRDPVIDGMRVAAIAYILLHHSDDYGFQFLRATAATAHLDDVLTWVALAALFILSGYLAAVPRRSESGLSHIRRRLARLYPPFAAALIAFWVLDAVAVQPRGLVVNLALLGPWIGPDVGTLWFVEILLFFQIAYGLTVASRRTSDRPWLIPALLGVATIPLLLVGCLTGSALDNRLALYLPAFAAGAALGALADSKRQDAPAKGTLAAAAVSVGALFVLTAVLPLRPAAPATAIAAVLATTLIVCAVLVLRRSSAPVFPTTVLSRVVRYLAVASFMAYLIHRIVFRFASELAAPLHVEPSIAVVTSIPVVLGVSVLLQQAYDRAAGSLRVAASPPGVTQLGAPGPCSSSPRSPRPTSGGSRSIDEQERRDDGPRCRTRG